MTDKLQIDINTTETSQELQILTDPILWCEKYLCDPNDPSRSLKLRWYQKKMICAQPKVVDYNEDNKMFVFKENKKVYRLGRRMGKTVVLAAEILWRAFTHGDQKIMVVAPYKTQVNFIFNAMEKLIGNGIVDSALTLRRFKSFHLQFTNGSEIRGFTANVAAGPRAAESIRGAGANMLVIDEVDYIPDKAIDTILAIFTERTDSYLLVSSTPSGRRGFFYNICTFSKSLGWKHFHYKYPESPVYDPDIDAEMKRTLGPEEYKREMLAEFGEEVATVFSHEDINAALEEYYFKDTKINDKLVPGTLSQYNYKNTYIMGVDWNLVFGVAVVVLEFIKDEGRYRIWYTKRIGRTTDSNDDIKYSQLKAVEWIREFHSKYKMDWIYVDRGYGEVQIELLHAYGLSHPTTNLHKIVKPVDFAGNIEVFDPVTGEKSRKKMKYFAVNQIHTMLSSNMLILPDFKDEKFEIVGQLREFRVKTSQKTGEPIFVGENDHFVSALMCAVIGFFDQSNDPRFKKHITKTYTSVKVFKYDKVSRQPVEESKLDRFFDKLGVKKVSIKPITKPGLVFPSRYEGQRKTINTVSYTHLTLPTN